MTIKSFVADYGDRCEYECTYPQNLYIIKRLTTTDKLCPEAAYHRIHTFMHGYSTVRQALTLIGGEYV